MKRSVGCIWIPLALLLPALTAGLYAQCNANPTALNDRAEGILLPIWIDVLANDTEPDGEALTVAVLGTSCTGTTSVVLDMVRLDPAPAIREDCTLDYRTTDESGRSATARVDVTSLDRIFADTFELGGLDAWSELCPGGGCGPEEPDEDPEDPDE